MLAYTIASFADKQLELGAVLLAYYHYGSLRALLISGLAFQMTKVFTFLVRIPPSPCLAVAATLAAATLLHAGRDSLPVFLLGIVVFTAAVSYLRAWTKHLGQQAPGRERGQKQARDVVRACGFIFAPFFYPALVGALTVLALAASARAMTSGTRRPFELRLRIVGGTEPAHVAMFVHHVHYFAYSHLVPVVFAVTFGLLPAWQGLVFYLGWIGYDLYDFVKVRASWFRFFLGHFITALGILTLFWTSSPSLAAIGWLVTGVGGGTYVMLRRLTRSSDPEPGENLELAEHYGHVAGVLVLIALVMLSVTFAGIGAVASVLALMSPLLALAMRARPGRRLVTA